MPFGLQGAGATFQRMVDQILRGAHDFASAYMDDIGVRSYTWSDHLNHLRNVLTRLRLAGSTARPSKCRFGTTKSPHLGHVVGGGFIRPSPTKVAAIANIQLPATKSDLRSFLGLTGYYRRFIPHYAAVTSSLTAATKKHAPNNIDWTSAMKDSFTALKLALSSKPVLHAPDFDKPFYLQTDASNTGIGAILCQMDENGHEHPIVYLSRQLLPREKNYSTIEKECLATVWAVQQLHYYLASRKFTILSDHKPLASLQQR